MYIIEHFWTQLQKNGWVLTPVFHDLFSLQNVSVAEPSPIELNKYDTGHYSAIRVNQDKSHEVSCHFTTIKTYWNQNQCCINEYKSLLSWYWNRQLPEEEMGRLPSTSRRQGKKSVFWRILMRTLKRRSITRRSANRQKKKVRAREKEKEVSGAFPPDTKHLLFS